MFLKWITTISTSILEEFKCNVKEKKINKYIYNDLEISSDDSNEEDCNEEISDERN